MVNHNISKKSHYLIITILILFSLSLIILKHNDSLQDKKEQASIDYYFSKKTSDTKNTIGLPEKEITPYYAILKIPKINLTKGLVSPDSKDNNVNKNIYIAKNSLFPEDNKISHIILAAHSGYNGIAYFKDLNKLVSNDDIYLYYNSKKYTYRVAFSYEIEKNGYLTYNTRSVSDLYLITCLKNTDRQIVYVANLIMEENI